MLRHPFAGHALGLGDLVGGHAFGQEVAVVHGIVTFLAGLVARGCEVGPFVRLHIVLRNALAFGVHETEVMHGFNVALVGGLPEPLHRLRIVLCDASAVVVMKTEVELREGVAPLGTFLSGIKGGPYYAEDVVDNG